MNIKRLALVGLLMSCMPVANAEGEGVAIDAAGKAQMLAQVQAGYAANQAKVLAACGPQKDPLRCETNYPCSQQALLEDEEHAKCAVRVLMPSPVDFAK